MTDAEVRDDLELALDAVRAAGRVVMETFGTDMDVRHKGPDQPVTRADLEVDALLSERLTRSRPDYGWLSEETADSPERLERARVWVVDPVDGTRSFVAGYPEFAISVALVVDAAPVLGVIHNPAADYVVWATVGGGAWGREGWDRSEGGRSNESGADASPTLLDAMTEAGLDTLLASRSERGSGEFEPFEDDWAIREVGSTAWKMAGAAMGRGAYISRGPKSEWDVAAGVLIVAEAGGRATDLQGDPIAFNRREPYVHGVVAARPESHARLLARARTLDSPRLYRDAWQGDPAETEET